MREAELEAPRCVALGSIGDAEAGGKAQGLARLIGLGLRVPPGFVILGASPGDLPDTSGRLLRSAGRRPRGRALVGHR